MARSSFSNLLFVLASLVCASGLNAQSPEPFNLEIGGRTVKVPAPAGFVRCDGIDEKWDNAMKSVLPASNRMLATFGTAEDQDLLRKGTPSDYLRNFNIQTIRTTESLEIGERTFSDLRGQIKKELLAMQSKIETEVKKLAGQGNKHLQDNYGVNAALSISDTAVLGFFEETGASLGFTMVMKVGISTPDGKREESRAVGACVMAPVNGRLIALYSTAPYTGEPSQKEVESTVQAWRDAIVAINPKVQGPAGGFDWEKVLRQTIIGAGIGLLVGIGMWVAKKFKRPQAS